MFCEKCGKEINKNKKFCGHCGHKIEKQTSVKDFTDKYTSTVIAALSAILIIVIIPLLLLINSQPPVKDSGIGVMISDKNNVVVVEEVNPNLPAHQAGIQAGDTIIKVNNKLVFDTNTACDMMRGKEGTKVKVTVLHDHKPTTYKLTRHHLDN